MPLFDVNQLIATHFSITATVYQHGVPEWQRPSVDVTYSCNTAPRGEAGCSPGWIWISLCSEGESLSLLRAVGLYQLRSYLSQSCICL